MVILFDGVCNLCNSFVQFVIKHDKKNIFQFASLQSNYGAGLLGHFNLTNHGLDTILLYDGKQVLPRSHAVIKIVSSLGGFWKTAVIFKIVPEFIRNGIYIFLAKRRYSLFGKRDSCMIPTPELQDKFLDNAQFS